VAHFLFIDESGYDSGLSPYGVLGGVAIEDRDVWNLIKAIQDAELLYFGTRYSVGQKELKAKKLISPQVFRQAAVAGEIAFPERTELAKRCLERGAGAPPRAIAALAQAKLEYVREVLEICSRFRCRAFASVVDKDSSSPGTDHLRKDYAYLFERFFYFLEDMGPDTFGVAVFDKLDKDPESSPGEPDGQLFQTNHQGPAARGPDSAGAALRAQRPDPRCPTCRFGGVCPVLGVASSEHDEAGAPGTCRLHSADLPDRASSRPRGRRQPAVYNLELRIHHGPETASGARRRS
jgi:hypothetical protein